MRTRFRETASQFQSVYLGVLSVSVVVISLSLLLFPSLEPGSASRAITVINLSINAVLVVVTGCLYWWSSKAQIDERE